MVLFGYASAQQSVQAEVVRVGQPMSQHSSQAPVALFASAQYQYDDGTPELHYGHISTTTHGLYANNFVVEDGATCISEVNFIAGWPSGSPRIVGAYVWSDPNGDGAPTDAVLLGSSTDLAQPDMSYNGIRGN